MDGKARLRNLLSSNYFSVGMLCVVLVDFVFILMDVDARAADIPSPALTRLVGIFCVLIYTLELAVLFFAAGFGGCRDRLVDLLAVVLAWADLILQPESFRLLSFLRLRTMFRLTFILAKKTPSLHGLHTLLVMMDYCTNTLLWSFLFVFVYQTIWAMLFVEVLYPIVNQQHMRAHFAAQDCEQCLRAFSSVMNANLWLFQSVVAGDNWGSVAMPLIQEHPWTVLMFSLLTLVYAVLNCIVAVVVEVFAEARTHDILLVADEMKHDLDRDTRFLQRLFSRVDRDKSGKVAKQELMQAVQKDSEFQSLLRVMKMDEADLQQIFDIFDADGSGSIDAEEFMVPLRDLAHECKMATPFLKYNMLRTIEQQEELQSFAAQQFKDLKSQMDALASTVAAAHRPEPVTTSHAGAEATRGARKWPVGGQLDVEALLLATEARLQQSMARVEAALSELRRTAGPAGLQSQETAPEAAGLQASPPAVPARPGQLLKMHGSSLYAAYLASRKSSQRHSPMAAASLHEDSRNSSPGCSGQKGKADPPAEGKQPSEEDSTSFVTVST